MFPINVKFNCAVVVFVANDFMHELCCSWCEVVLCYVLVIHQLVPPRLLWIHVLRLFSLVPLVCCIVTLACTLHGCSDL